jgi:two-component system, NarL family, nitrate/nitrite response regulator NarL
MADLINVAIIDDDRMLLDGFASWLGAAADLRLTGAFVTVDELLASAGKRPDVVVLDLLLRDGSRAVDNVGRLLAAGLRVLVISVWPDLVQVADTFAAGASGYLTKDHDLDALAEAIRTVVGGGTAYSPELALACLRHPRPDRPALSIQERGVLLAYASGMTLGAAARHVGVQPETAKTYLDRVKAKYQAVGRPTRTKLELADRVREDGLDGPNGRHAPRT